MRRSLVIGIVGIAACCAVFFSVTADQTEMANTEQAQAAGPAKAGALKRIDAADAFEQRIRTAMRKKVSVDFDDLRHE